MPRIRRTRHVETTRIEGDSAGGANPILRSPATIRTGHVRRRRNPAEVDQPPLLRLHGGQDPKPGIFDATNVYRGVVGLDRLLALHGDQLGPTLDHIMGEFEQATGIPIPEDTKAAIRANPGMIDDHLEALAPTPKELIDGGKALVALHQARGGGAELGKKYAIPGSTLDLAAIMSVDLPPPDHGLKRVAAGIYRGDRPGKIGKRELHRNTVMAEVFDRLGDNERLREGQERFTVTLGGRTASTLGELVDLLRDNGYEISIRFAHRIANFANVKTKAHDEPDSRARHVPMALPIDTGIAGPDGTHAYLPACHAEMIVAITGRPEGKPRLDSKVKFFQGMSSTGFFAADSFETHPWLGWKETAVGGQTVITGEKAKRAVELAGLFSDLINEIASDLHLPNGGYLYLGWCLDTVQYVLSGIGGPLTYWPLGGNDGVLGEEIRRRAAVEPKYQPLLEIIHSVPSDAAGEGADTAKQRMLATIPHAPGKEVFASERIARGLIEASLG
jgi:hypothetical protein